MLSWIDYLVTNFIWRTVLLFFCYGCGTYTPIRYSYISLFALRQRRRKCNAGSCQESNPHNPLHNLPQNKQLVFSWQLRQDVQEHESVINQSPGRFQKHKDPAALPDTTVINLCGNVAYDQVRPGTTGISVHGNVAYVSYNHEQDPADDHQYEKLDE